MLDQFEVRDLPEVATEVVLESTPLKTVAKLVCEQVLELVAVKDVEFEQVRGVVPAEAVLRLARRIPDAPVGMLPMQLVLEVPAATTLVEALRAVTSADVVGIAIRDEARLMVVLKERLTALDSWDELQARRHLRLGSAAASA